MKNDNKPNDMLLSTLSNPEAKTLDFLNNGVTPETTQLLDREDYKNNDVIKEQFTNQEGVFDETVFNNAYDIALNNYNKISDENFFNSLDSVKYEMYDWTRPVTSEVRAVDIKYKKDYNPYQTLYNRDHFGSMTESELSLREIAQRGRIYDVKTDTWSDKSVNDLSIFDKFFGDTLVYAQWDEDGIHQDLVTGNMVKHSAGDWKSDEYGKLYAETLGDREIYGRQVINPSDILTTDGSVFNKFDFFDSDGRDKSLGKVALNTIVEIAPLLIPGVNTVYGGARAALGLATVMPTFLKSLTGMLLGDSMNFGDDPITKAEGWMAKYRTPSTSDAGSESMWNVEQMAQMVTGIFSQIYEQRAMASLSKYMIRPEKLLNTKAAQLQASITAKAIRAGELSGVDTSKAIQNAVKNLPELKKMLEAQSNVSKGLSLGYMALSSTSEIYGEALAGGFDRRSAGFAALLAAGGQYGLMMNNRMGDWFLDKTTGYTTETNKALMKKSVKPWLGEINKVFTDSGLTKEQQKVALAGIVKKFSTGAKSFFKGPSILGEAMLKNSAIEGVEEVTEEMVGDMSKGVLDIMSYLGLTKNKGSFGTVERFQTGEWFDDYLASFVGGVLGGGLFELEAARIDPWMRKVFKGEAVKPQTKHSIYELVANGHKKDLIKIIKNEAPKLTNNYLSYRQDINVDSDTKSKMEADFVPSEGASQSDLVAKSAIEMIEHLEGILGSEGLDLTDEEIINKAIGNEIKIDALEKLRIEGKHVGIEGLLLEDYKRTAYEAADLKDALSQKTEGADTKTETKKTKSKDSDKDSKPKEPKKRTKAEEATIQSIQEKFDLKMKEVEEILNGERNMKYFNMLTVALNPQISRIFGALDRHSYIEAKYDLDYNQLPDKGTEGLTKESAKEEWAEFIDSTDMLKKLEVITKGYTDLETTLNKPIADTIESGYFNIRKVTHDDFLDLQRTVKSFNVATSPEARQIALEDFIAINKYLESKGVTKVLPWDSYRTNIAQKLDNEGLIKKAVVNQDGDTEYVEYSQEELNAELGNGKTLRDTIYENINSIVGQLPTSPLDVNLIIGQYNSSIATNNETLRNKIIEIENSNLSPEQKQSEIKLYEGSISDSFLDSISNSRSKKAFDDANLESYKKEIARLEGEVSEDTLSKYLQDPVFRKDYMDNKNVVDQYSANTELRKKFTVDGKIKSLQELMEHIKITEQDVSKWTAEDKLKFLEQLADMGILSPYLREITENIENLEISIEEYIDNLELALNDSEDVDTDNEIRTSLKNFEDQINLFPRIEATYNRHYHLLTNNDITKLLKERSDLNKKYMERATDAMPDIFKMPDYAFDFLLDALESGHFDNELYLKAKDIYKNNLKSLYAKVMPQAFGITLDTINRIAMLGDVGDSNLYTLVDDFMNLDDLDLINDTENGTVGEALEFIEHYFNLEDGNYLEKALANSPKTLEALSIVRELLTNNFNPSDSMSSVAQNLVTLQKSLSTHKTTLEQLSRFEGLSESDMVHNPIYDMLRDFNMQMDSNPNSKVNTIFKIAEREETAFKASSGADQYTSIGVNTMDMQQAINLIDMFKTVVNSMSTTQRFGDDFNGFLAMRQDFAKRMGIEDAVTDLKTIDSDQAALLSRDLDVLRTRLEFIKELSAENQRNKAAAERKTGERAIQSHIEVFRELEGVHNLTPANFKDTLNSSLEPEEILLKLETDFYEHNKGDKEGAMEKILKYHLKNVNVADSQAYTDKTTSKTLSPYNKAMYFATMLSLNSSDYMFKQKQSLEGDFSKAPFYIQAYGGKIIVATTQNPEVFNKIYELKPNKLNDTAEFITLVLGGTGTGKTSVMGAQALDILRQTNENSNVWLGGPTMEQATTLHSDIVDAIGEKNLNLTKVDSSKLFELMGEGINDIRKQIHKELKTINSENNEIIELTKDNTIKININPDWANKINYDNLPNMLIFDEITHLSKPEILLLNFISKSSFNNKSGNFFKVVGMGDSSQLGFQVEVQNIHSDLNISGLNSMLTPYLTSSIRSNNNQKRVNAEMLLRNVEKAIDIFKEESSKVDTNYSLANKAFKDFLLDVNNESGLSYFLKDNKFRGDFISDTYKHSQVLQAMKHDIDSKIQEGEEIPTIRILTEDGEISPDILASMKSVGMDEDFINRHVTINTLANVQGAESDYFIFDMAILPDYDKNRDLMRAFYTYTMRSKVGTLIYDTGGRIAKELGFTNATMSDSTVDFHMLNEDTVNELKKQRINEINKLLGDFSASDESDYTWRSGKKVLETSSLDSEDPNTDTKGKGSSKNVSTVRSDKNATNFKSEFSSKLIKTIELFKDDEVKQPKDPKPGSQGKISPTNFKGLGHSFLHIPNASVKFNSKGEATSIKPQTSRSVKLDLNLNAEVSGIENAQKVVNDWASLKADLLQGNTNINVSKYRHYIENIFGESTKNVNVEYVSTAQIYDSSIHSPIFSHVDSSGALKNGDLMRMISAKLTSGKGEGAKVHYISLAIFPSIQTFSTKGMEVLNAPKTTKTDYINKYVEANSKIKKAVKKTSDNFMETGKIKASDLEIITSTVLHPSKVQHSLNELAFKFPGMKVSEIRLFPNDLEVFTNLINKYTFGEARTKEQIETLFSGKNANGDTVHEPFAGKPYVVVSYRNDLNGVTKGERTSARLIPINARSRGISEVTLDIQKIRKQVSDSKRKGEDVPLHLNAIQDALFDKSQLLDILIEWGNTPTKQGSLLDNLTETVIVPNYKLDKATKLSKSQEVSVLDLLANFKEGSLTKEALSSVIDVVRKHTGENFEDLATAKKEILEGIAGTIGWSWDFRNLFVYEKNISNYMQYKSGLKTKNTSNFEKLSNLAKPLYDSLRNKKFYYSVPILPGGGANIKVNDYIAGTINGKFESEFYADKFYFMLNPQSERILFPLDAIMNPDVTVKSPTKKSKVKVSDSVVHTMITELFNSSVDYDDIFEGLSNVKGYELYESLKKEISKSFDELANISDNEARKEFVALLEHSLGDGKTLNDPEVVDAYITRFSEVLHTDGIRMFKEGLKKAIESQAASNPNVLQQVPIELLMDLGIDTKGIGGGGNSSITTENFLMKKSSQFNEMVSNFRNIGVEGGIESFISKLDAAIEKHLNDNPGLESKVSSLEGRELADFYTHSIQKIEGFKVTNPSEVSASDIVKYLTSEGHIDMKLSNPEISKAIIKAAKDFAQWVENDCK